MIWNDDALLGMAKGILRVVQEKVKLEYAVADLRRELETERERRRAVEAELDATAGNLWRMVMKSPAVVEALSSDESLKVLFPPNHELCQG